MRVVSASSSSSSFPPPVVGPALPRAPAKVPRPLPPGVVPVVPLSQDPVVHLEFLHAHEHSYAPRDPLREEPPDLCFQGK